MTCCLPSAVLAQQQPQPQQPDHLAPTSESATSNMYQPYSNVSPYLTGAAAAAAAAVAASVNGFDRTPTSFNSSLLPPASEGHSLVDPAPHPLSPPASLTSASAPASSSTVTSASTASALESPSHNLHLQSQDYAEKKFKLEQLHCGSVDPYTSSSSSTSTVPAGSAAASAATSVPPVNASSLSPHHNHHYPHHPSSLMQPPAATTSHQLTPPSSSATPPHATHAASPRPLSSHQQMATPPSSHLQQPLSNEGPTSGRGTSDSEEGGGGPANESGRVHYISDRVTLTVFYASDTQTEVDDHFTKAINMQQQSYTEDGGKVIPLSERSLPASFWDQNHALHNRLLQQTGQQSNSGGGNGGSNGSGGSGTYGDFYPDPLQGGLSGALHQLAASCGAADWQYPGGGSHHQQRPRGRTITRPRRP